MNLQPRPFSKSRFQMLRCGQFYITHLTPFYYKKIRLQQNLTHEIAANIVEVCDFVFGQQLGHCIKSDEAKFCEAPLK